jgi:hypothetical protein
MKGPGPPSPLKILGKPFHPFLSSQYFLPATCHLLLLCIVVSKKDSKKHERKQSKGGRKETTQRGRGRRPRQHARGVPPRRKSPRETKLRGQFAWPHDRPRRPTCGHGRPRQGIALARSGSGGQFSPTRTRARQHGARPRVRGRADVPSAGPARQVQRSQPRAPGRFFVRRRQGQAPRRSAPPFACPTSGRQAGVLLPTGHGRQHRAPGSRSTSGLQAGVLIPPGHGRQHRGPGSRPRQVGQQRASRRGCLCFFSPRSWQAGSLPSLPGRGRTRKTKESPPPVGRGSLLFSQVTTQGYKVIRCSTIFTWCCQIRGS